MILLKALLFFLFWILLIVGGIFGYYRIFDILREFAEGFDQGWPVQEEHFFTKKVTGYYRGEAISAEIWSNRSVFYFWVGITASPALHFHLVDKRSRASGFGPPIWLIRETFSKPLMIKHDSQAAFDEWLTRHNALFCSFIDQFNLMYLECKSNQVRLGFHGIPKKSSFPLLWQVIEALLEGSENPI